MVDDIETLLAAAQAPIPAHPYHTLDQFCRQKRCYITDRDLDRRPLTHTLYSGGSLHIPESLQPTFDHLMASDLRSGRSIFFAEIAGPIFRCFCDFDIQMIDHPSDGKALAIQLGQILQQAMSKFVSGNHTLIISSAPLKEKKEGDSISYCPNYHFNWPEVVVDRTQALYLREMAVSLFNGLMPLVNHTCVNAWEDRIDEDVYRDKCGGLRMLGNCKTVPCECKGKGQCWEPHFGKKYMKNGGRPYTVIVVLDEKGQEKPELTKTLQTDWYAAVALTRLRVSKDVTQRKDWHYPKNCPHPSSNEDVQMAGKRHRKRKNITDQVATKERRIFRFKESAQHLREKFPAKVWLDVEDLLFKELEEVVRSTLLHANYKNIGVNGIFTNRKHTFFVICVDGEGCHYCLNKQRDHTTSTVYFYINSELHISQRCMSKKTTIRPHGKVPCSDWESHQMPLPVKVQDMIMLKRSGSAENFVTYRHRQLIGDRYAKLYSRSGCENPECSASDIRRIFSNPSMVKRLSELKAKNAQT